MFVFLRKLDSALLLPRRTRTALTPRGGQPSLWLSAFSEKHLCYGRTGGLTRGKEPDLQGCLHSCLLAGTIW